MVRKVRMVKWSSVQKDIKDEMTLSIVHKYHGQKGQNGQMVKCSKRHKS